MEMFSHGDEGASCKCSSWTVGARSGAVALMMGCCCCFVSVTRPDSRVSEPPGCLYVNRAVVPAVFGRTGVFVLKL